ncbi:hypothetical protein JZK55_15500 [Dissulfurispira thermophila]|uniref:GTP-binding protein n=2 Tax=root TaxID=1 RepID=A0A7G1H1V9_9BACT|nr:DUF4416 family protein [Dissulfurispira thermophila]BCB96628.1 hypothetical protein JZK55_15500 [Dissulfurispira thermophila]
MGSPTPPDKALLFIGTLFSNEDYYIEAQQSLERIFGEIVMETPAIKWDFSDYYKDELGESIYRRFVFFKKLIHQENLSTIKLITNELEKSLSSDVNGVRRRNINLDPGYLTPAKIVLASTKDYSHRIYLKDGIYAEVTLIFKKGQFIPHINTYRDYQDEKYLRIFMIARKLLNILRQSEGQRTDFKSVRVSKIKD